MTTADTLNLGGQPILDERLEPADLFATGAGYVNLLKANDPGLVYDIEPNDYIPYLCGLGYTEKQVSIIVQQEMKCPGIKSIPEQQLNYPSVSIKLGSTLQWYTRTLINVGPANSTYGVEVDLPLGVSLSFSPGVLEFTEAKQKITYSVGFVHSSTEIRGSHTGAQGSFTWVSGKYCVRTPIYVIFQ